MCPIAEARNVEVELRIVVKCPNLYFSIIHSESKQHNFENLWLIWLCSKQTKKFRIRETLNLSTDADSTSSTNTKKDRIGQKGHF